jgi:16S rRNA (uracil1498-N3)-methyltransferase
MKRRWRIYHPDLDPEGGRILRLRDDEAHHVRKVLRLGPGEELLLFDGDGAEWRAEIVVSSAAAVEVRLLRPSGSAAEPPVDVEIFQGLCRHDRMEWLIQKGTEIGVKAIHPFVCERAEHPGVKPRRLERWRRIAIEAAKQSGRSVVPGILPQGSLPRPSPGALPVLLSTADDQTPLGDLIAEEQATAFWLAVGPESGFSEDESARWLSEGWLPAALGPRILRTETAGLVAAAIILHLRGDIGGRSG